ncbi:hypothetical protein BJX68DRAFT_217606 [Aspergillus pseudodeflectus]|uniref:Uncharacterized protein n=1 Tax=Aspergillus pseudodeflectus TaxID=176178 RepID=A0ABR4KTS8_9EURO
MADGWATHVVTTDTTDASGNNVPLTVVTLDPPTTTIAPSTRYIWPGGTTTEIYITWISDISHVRTNTYTSDAQQATPRPTASDTDDNTTTTEPQTTPQTTSATSTATAQTTSSDSTSSVSQSATQTPGIDSGSSSGHGVSTGALAGAIVGSVIGSALLTLLLAFLFFRRRRSPPKGASDDDVTLTAIVTDKSNTGFSLAAIIPQPADDDTVRRRILTLVDHAGLHVDNYYASGSSVTLTQDGVSRLNSYDSGYLPAAASTVLGERPTQRQVITHLLVYKLLGAVGPGGELLPLLLAAQPRIENSSVSTDNALFTWRMLTAHLYRQGKYNQDTKETAALKQAAHNLAADFTSAFTPYALSSFSETDRVTHFRDLAAAVTELGVWLFAQPCTFEFVWTKSQTEITTVPRVLKTYDEQGNRLVTAQVLIEGERVTFRR